MRHLILATLLSTAVFSFAQGESDTSHHYTGTFKIDTIKYDIGDAFTDSKAHTKYDTWIYDFLNTLHIETKESTLRKLLLFNQGDVVDDLTIQEAERFLRTQKYLSDAKISVESENGKNVANVKTSDNWTLTLPIGLGFNGNERTYKNFVWSVGIQESNFLGLGQLVGLSYQHTYYRDMWLLEYSDPHFLFRFNQLDLNFSYNTDGYQAYWRMYVPFLNRSKNQWAYTLEGVKNQSTYYAYGSGDLPQGSVPYETEKPLDSIQKYNGKYAVNLLKVREFQQDSLSFRLSRSFGGAQRKLYIGASYDYNFHSAKYGTLSRNMFHDGDDVYVIDSASAWNDWLPERKDSRLGLYLQLSNLYYIKAVNLHHVKWTEDVEKGYSLKTQISKNYEQLGSDNNDVRIDLWANLYLGSGMHHANLKSESRFYLDHWSDMHDFYGRVQGEYIFHPTNNLSTVVKGIVDFYDNAKLGYQLSLGGTDGFVGFQPGYYTGQARVFGTLEQRVFLPKIEVLTLTPALVAFGSVGETAWDIRDINRKDLVYAIGFGARFAQTKSISRLINKFDISFPLNGQRKGEPHVSFTTTTSL